ncbi:MAG: hypothetical protein NTZ43_00885 [Gemmatimonadetes bacterium]|nr:hypothetical protein [Gemmatimonadota bacterium]
MMRSVTLAAALLLAWGTADAQNAVAKAVTKAAPSAEPQQSVTKTAAPAEPTMGSYQSTRINGKPLPVTDLASDDEGVQYVIEFDELILSLRPGREFRAALRYRQTLAAKGDKLGRAPVQKMTVYGTWTTAGNALRFVPDPKRGGQGLQMLDGTFGANSISVPFDYRNGSVRRRANVVLAYNPNIF